MYNGHADVVGLVNAAGQAMASYYYDAFGNIMEQTGSVNNPIRYAGYQYDMETGLYYLNARMYDPVTARFMQEDSYTGDSGDPLSLNLYTYCHNEPIMYLDPTGHVQENMGGRDSVFVIGENAVYSSVDLTGCSGLVNNGKADNVTVAAGGSVYIINNSTIGDITIMKNASAIIANSEVGSITNILSKPSSSAVIYNDGNIDLISTGAGSRTNIDNGGTIKEIVTGTKSTTSVENQGKINHIKTGINSKTTIDNDSVILKINAGAGSLIGLDNDGKAIQVVKGKGSRIVKTNWNGGTFDGYVDRSIKQFALGNYTDEVTALGTGLQIGTGLLNLDLPADIRDLSADIKQWQWSKAHAGKTLIDAIALFPVIGSLKYADEVETLVKGAGKTGVKVNVGQQNKHIPGTNNYKQEIANGKTKSILTENAQSLLDDFAGTGQKIGTNKERVDFGKTIGQYYDIETGTFVDTTKGIIHYDSKGQAHIVPARP